MALMRCCLFMGEPHSLCVFLVSFVLALMAVHPPIYRVVSLNVGSC
jgi:hypothetical protein